ncbi:hypothetical protein ACNKHU_17995 [Shigella flexneri]
MVKCKWVYYICHTIGAITLFMAAQVTTPEVMFLVILINSFAYMPTLGLINTISYYRLQNAGWISLLTSRQSVSGHHRLYHGNVGGEPVWLRIKPHAAGILAQHFPPFWFCLP